MSRIPTLTRPRRTVRGAHIARLIDPPASEDPDRPLLALADAGDVNGALQGFRVQGTVEREVEVRPGKTTDLGAIRSDKAKD